MMMMMIKLRVNHVMLYFYAKVVQCTTSVGERFLFFFSLSLRSLMSIMCKIEVFSVVSGKQQ